ncbi:hypothetical protein B0H12DRAFT_1077782 [Mycena haematopus]|nr:hypothetical protein B0H12DRAFT_1077782 [Mycena haematopus]
MTTNAGSYIDARASALYPNLDMEFPSLLLSTYGAEISFDLNISTITMPGVAVAGKLVIVQISKELIVLMVGVIGHKKPLFCLADWSTTKTEVEAVRFFRVSSGSQHAERVNGGIVQSCQPGVKLRIVLANQAAFWALAYLILKSSSTVAPPTVFRSMLNIMITLWACSSFSKRMLAAKSVLGMASVNPVTTTHPDILRQGYSKTEDEDNDI